MKNSTRRNFLKQVGALGVVAQSGVLANPLVAAHSNSSLWLPSKNSRSIVCIYLRGGADWLNMMVPYKDSDYAQVRPTLALTEDDGIIKLDSKWALHPALASLAPLYKAKSFAPVIATGSPHTTRSHFDAQDFMEFAAPGNRTVRSGWLNRYLEVSAAKESSKFRAMAMQELLPRSLRGQFPVLAVPSGMDKKRGSATLNRFEEFYGDASMPAGEAMDGGENMGNQPEDDPTGIVRSGRVTIDILRRYQEIVSKGKSGVKYPGGRFAARLQSIAKVIKSGEGLEVAGVDYNGWDHHANEGTLEGRQAAMLKDLGDSIAAFCTDLGPVLENTTVIVMTEFGRTVKENGNNGTDHGHGSGMFVFGGGVKGGKVHGSWRGLKPEQLYQQRDLAVTTDFRDVFHSVLLGTFGFKPKKDFFPDYKSNRISGLF
jgi:uncharacterized protein (DUF1501 family)